MGMWFKSICTALLVASSVQVFTVGVLAPKLPPEVCRPLASQQRQLSLDSAKLVHINNGDGSLAVVAEERGDIFIQADMNIYGPHSGMKPVAEQYLATLIQEQALAESMFIITEPEDRPDAMDLRVDYALRVPIGTNITYQGANGNVAVQAGCGRVTVKGNYADIVIHEPLGAVRARTVTGRIRVTSAKADTTLEAVNGSINVNILGGSLTASTTTGSIAASIDDPRVESTDLNTVNGNITLHLARLGSTELHATTGNGSVVADMPPGVRPAVQRRRELHATIGSGQSKLKMHCLNGDIQITRSQA